VKALLSLNIYFWKYRAHFFWGIAFILLTNLFSIYPAQVVRLTFDFVEDLLLIKRFFGDAEWFGVFISSSLFFLGGIVVIMALVRGIFLFFTRQTIIAMSRRIEYDQKNALYEHYQELSLAFHRRHQTGDLMAHISEDVGKVRMYTGPGIMYTINAVTLFFMTLATMLSVNVELTLYALLPLPVLTLSIYLVESLVIRKSEAIQEKLSNLTSFTQESFSGIRVLKSFIREPSFRESFAEEGEDYRAKSLSLAKVNAFFFPMILLLIGLGTLFTVWVGSARVMDGTLTVGNIAEFVIYLNLLTWPVVSLGWITTLIQRAAASQARIMRHLNEQPEIAFPEHSDAKIAAGKIEFKDVSFTYPETGIKALDKVSFTIEPGTSLAILGRTGSGKSSLANLLLRLYDPDAGEILIDQKTLKSFSKENLRKPIGYVPQDVILFSDSIEANIAFGLPDAGIKEVTQAAAKAAVLENINDFPEGMNTVIGERGITLSGGQKQRISIARAWLKNPLIFILDDSLSAVDTATEEEILSNLRAKPEIGNSPTLILISHRISSVKHADKIIVLEKGRVAESGTHDELLKQKGIYAGINRIQQLEEAFQVAG